MIRIIFFTVLFFQLQNIHSQKIQWSANIGEGADVKASDFKHGKTGNCYLIGNFYGEAQFDTVTLYTNLISNVFLVKFDHFGKQQWVKQIEGINSYNDSKLGIDDNENLYVTGTFNSSIKFDTLSLKSKGSNDIFLSRYSNSGEVLWANQIGGNMSDLAGDIDARGNLYITGTFRGMAIFEDTTLFSLSDAQLFFAKYNTHGKLNWVKTFENLRRGHDILTDTDNNIYLAGEAMKWNIFIAKYDSSGFEIWSKYIQTGAFGKANTLSVDNQKSLYCIGSFFNFANFETKTINTSDFNETFFVKYDEYGNEQWVKNYELKNVQDYIEFNDIYTLGNYIYTTSILSGTVTIENINFSDKIASDIIIMIFHKDGTLFSSIQVNGNSAIEPVGIEVNQNNEIILAGHFRNELSTGKITLKADTYNSFLLGFSNPVPDEPNKINFTQINKAQIPIIAHNGTDLLISFSKKTLKQEKTIKIISMNGQVVTSYTTNDLGISLSINHLSKGIYIVTFQGSNLKSSFRYCKAIPIY